MPAACSVEANHPEVVAVLQEAGLDRAASRVARCGADGLVCGCGHGHYRRVSVRCGHRLCPDCAPKRAAKLAHVYKPGVRAFRYPVLLTLTIRNLPNLWREDLQKMKRAFARLRRRAVFAGHVHKKRCKRCPLAARHDAHRDGWAECRLCGCSGARPRAVTGGLCALEVTASELAGWHPHLHIIADLPQFLSVFHVGAEWRDACEAEGLSVGDYGADMEAIDTWARKKKRQRGGARNGIAISRDAAVDYALKYVTKGDVPETMRAQYAVATSRVRLVQPFAELMFCRNRKPTDLAAEHRKAKLKEPTDAEWKAHMDAWGDRRRTCTCPACAVAEARKAPRKMLPMCACCIGEWLDEKRQAFTDEEYAALAAKALAIEGRDYQGAVRAVGGLLAAGAPHCEWKSWGLYSSMVRWAYERADLMPDDLLDQVDRWLRAEEGGHAASAN